MEPFLAFFTDHGSATVFVAVLLERLGAPIPAFPFLLLAGAEGVADPRFLGLVFVAATVASLVADYAWYVAGRRWGRSMLGLLCRVSPSPQGYMSRSEGAFARRRALTLVASKFVPGLSLVVPPLAGAVKMSARTFLAVDLAASALWSAVGVGLGMVFHAQVEQAIAFMEAWGSTAVLTLLAALAAWLGWRAGRAVLAGRVLATLRSRPELLSALDASLRLLPRRRNLPPVLARLIRRAAYRGIERPSASRLPAHRVLP
ncbi:MAG: DedA family protein [Burkholderiaceae bacterium]|nr:DedA family protein [Burkholderiaceae bacterium]